MIFFIFYMKSGLCFFDIDTVVFSNQSHLSDLNLNFIFINLKEWISLPMWQYFKNGISDNLQKIIDHILHIPY